MSTRTRKQRPTSAPAPTQAPQGATKSQGSNLFGKQRLLFFFFFPRSPRGQTLHAATGNQTHLLLILLLHGNRSLSTCSALQAATGTWRSPPAPLLRCVPTCWQPPARRCGGRRRGSTLDGVRWRGQAGAAASPHHPTGQHLLACLLCQCDWGHAHTHQREAKGSQGKQREAEGVGCGGSAVPRETHGPLHEILIQFCGEKERSISLSKTVITVLSDYCGIIGRILY